MTVLAPDDPSHGTSAGHDRGCGCEPCRRARSTRAANRLLRLGQVPGPPQYLGLRAIALTCGQCGTLRTALPARRSARPRCPLCNAAAVRRWEKGNLERRRRNRTSSRRRAQNATADRAVNSGKEWTGPELEVAARVDLTSAEAAVLLGRTVYGVMTVRHRMKFDPRVAYLAGQGDAYS